MASINETAIEGCLYIVCDASSGLQFIAHKPSTFNTVVYHSDIF